MSNHPVNPVRFLRLPEVLARTGWSRSTLYRRISEGKFPAPSKDGPRISSWPDVAVRDWQRTVVNSELMDLIG